MSKSQPASAHLGKYEIGELIGEGATASVYHARDTTLNRDVAIKILKPALIADPVAFTRFAQEAQTSATIFHPHIAAVLDMGEAQGRYYIVLQYISGQSLDAYLRANGTLPVQEVMRMVEQVGEALDFIHKKGFLHRDVKPSNIMRADTGDYVLTDFGLLRALVSTGLTSHSGAILGTPSYIAPEIWLDQPASPATDQYALACVVVEALTGKILFTGDTPPAIMTSHVLKGAQVTEADGIPRDLLPVLRRALAKEADERYPSLSDFAQAVRSALEHPAVVPPPAVQQPVEDVQPSAPAASLSQAAAGGEPATPAPKRSRIFWWGAAAGLVLVIAALAYLFNGGYFSSTPTARPSAAAPAALPVEQDRQTDPRRFLACQITDVGGMEDRSFNATVWNGLLMAENELGIEPHFRESHQADDYAKNINAFIDEGCDLIVSSGYLLEDATLTAAREHPEQKFVIVDVAVDPPMDNVKSLTFATDQSSFLAGYLAASLTQTKVVATYGGNQIPPVTQFMDGFARGAAHYNRVNGENVQVIGWNPDAQEGIFIGNFEDIQAGRDLGQRLTDEGADIIFPVAGPIGLGTAEILQQTGRGWVIGVDTDWTTAAPEFADVILVSVLKRMDAGIFEIIASAQRGEFMGGGNLGTLENDGVGLSPIASRIPADQRIPLEEYLNGALRQAIIKGEVKTR